MADARKVLKAPPSHTRLRVKEMYAKDVALRWTMATTTQERESVRDMIKLVHRRDVALYVIAYATLRIAKYDTASAEWFVDFLK